MKVVQDGLKDQNNSGADTKLIEQGTKVFRAGLIVGPDDRPESHGREDAAADSLSGGQKGIVGGEQEFIDRLRRREARGDQKEIDAV